MTGARAAAPDYAAPACSTSATGHAREEGRRAAGAPPARGVRDHEVLLGARQAAAQSLLGGRGAAQAPPIGRVHEGRRVVVAGRCGGEPVAAFVQGGREECGQRRQPSSRVVRAIPGASASKRWQPEDAGAACSVASKTRIPPIPSRARSTPARHALAASGSWKLKRHAAPPCRTAVPEVGAGRGGGERFGSCGGTRCVNGRLHAPSHPARISHAQAPPHERNRAATGRMKRLRGGNAPMEALYVNAR